MAAVSVKRSIVYNFTIQRFEPSILLEPEAFKRVSRLATRGNAKNYLRKN